MTGWLARIAAVATIEFRRLVRARTSFTLLLMMPAMQVILFGYAIQPVPTSIRVGIAADSELSAARVADVLRGDGDCPSSEHLAQSGERISGGLASSGI